MSVINSFADPAHERRIGEIAAEVLPGVPVSLSCEVLPELREYERTVTTVANGYVQPQVQRYVSTLTERLREGGGRRRARHPVAATAASPRPPRPWSPR